jgi:hypothetical protein
MHLGTWRPSESRVLAEREGSSGQSPSVLASAGASARGRQLYDDWLSVERIAHREPGGRPGGRSRRDRLAHDGADGQEIVLSHIVVNRLRLVELLVPACDKYAPHRPPAQTLLSPIYKLRDTRWHVRRVVGHRQQACWLAVPRPGACSYRTAVPHENRLVALRVKHGPVLANLPGLSEEPIATETFLYAMTPDDDFVVERAGPIILGTGFGGHGFKFGPLMGNVLADLVQGKRVMLDKRFSRRRFSEAGLARTGAG